MPKCVKCQEVFPPNYVDIIEGSEPEVDGEYPKECIFCKLGIDKVERETEKDSGKYQDYTRAECLSDYKKFLRRLKDNQNVKEILKKAENSSRIIIN